jgi:hypothetical protein
MYRLWWPLALTWLMMAIEGPFLAAVIARMGESAVNLAAYGVAYAFGLITEAPVIMLLSASTRLARSRADYLRLRAFSILLCGAVTLLLVFLLLPPIAAVRFAKRLVGGDGPATGTDFFDLPRWVERALLALFRLEAAIVRACPVPAGVSSMLLAERRPATNHS